MIYGRRCGRRCQRNSAVKRTARDDDPTSNGYRNAGNQHDVAGRQEILVNINRFICFQKGQRIDQSGEIVCVVTFTADQQITATTPGQGISTLRPEQDVVVSVSTEGVSLSGTDEITDVP